eukprot:6136383-Prymnesium_polylepis.1
MLDLTPSLQYNVIAALSPPSNKPISSIMMAPILGNHLFFRHCTVPARSYATFLSYIYYSFRGV